MIMFTALSISYNLVTVCLCICLCSFKHSTSVYYIPPCPLGGCVLNGTKYAVGDPMPFDNPCHAPW